MVAQFKFTVLLMPNGPQKITGIAFDPSTCQSEHSITDEDIKKLLTTSTKKKTNKKKKPSAKDDKVDDWLSFFFSNELDSNWNFDYFSGNHWNHRLNT